MTRKTAFVASVIFKTAIFVSFFIVHFSKLASAQTYYKLPDVSQTLDVRVYEAHESSLLDISFIETSFQNDLLEKDGAKLHVYMVDAQFDHYVHLACPQPNERGHFVLELLRGLPTEGFVFVSFAQKSVPRRIVRVAVSRSERRPVEPQIGGNAFPSKCVGEERSEQDVRKIGPGFSVELQTSELASSVKSQLLLNVTRWGMPTRDLKAIYQQPGFAMIFNLDTGDLVQGRLFQMTPTEIEVAQHSGHELDDIPGIDGVHLWNGASVVGDLSIHVTLPSPGHYRLWVELLAEGPRASVPFDINAH